MATETPMRLMSGGGARNWSTSGGGLRYASSRDGAEQELGLLLSGQRLVNSREMVPNRSGSAPPSVEGSLAAIGGLFPQPNSSLESSWEGLGDALENFESEEQLRSDPAYLDYYYSRVNLNPRLPPPLNSREKRRLAGWGDKQKFRSLDDSNSRSLFSSRPVLPTHNEEPEEDRSPVANLIRQASSDWAERTSDYLTGLSTTLLGGRPKSLVDLIQEDFPRTPSPVYNHSRSSSRAANEEGVDANCSVDLQLVHLRDSAISSVKGSELNTTGLGSRSATPNPGGMHVLGVVSTSCPPAPSAPVARIPSPNLPVQSTQSGGPGEALMDEIVGLTGRSSIGDSELRNAVLSAAASTSDASNLAAALQGFSIADAHNMEDHTQQQQQPVQEERDQSHQLRLPQQQHQRHQRIHVTAAQGQQVQSQVLTQALHQQHQQNTGIEQAFRNQSKFFAQNLMQATATGLQPTLQPGAAAPHLYATAAAYMASGNPYYQNMQSAALYAPQYGIGGYPVNTTLLTPMMSGYPAHGAVPMAFDNAAAALAAGMNARVAATASPGGGMGVVDMQQVYKFNGQLGTTLQPNLTDPLYFHYLQRSAEDAYHAAALGDPLVARGYIGGNQMDTLELQKASMIGYATEQKSMFPRSGVLGVPIAGKSSSVSPAYYGSPPSMGLVMQYPSSPLASPVIPGSPGMAASLLARPNERNLHLPSGSNRVSMGAYSGWHSQRGNEKLDDMKGFSFLEELKNSKTRRFELSDIAGHVVEFSADQHGSRFIQQKLETTSSEEKALVFQEVLPQASRLMTDVFGNYVIQKFFEHGNNQQRKDLANQLVGQVLALSLQMYGCRVIQKALEVVDVDQQTQLVSELDGHIMRCVRDQNGNHVIQKCIECVPTDKIQFIISAFYGQVVTLSTHPYGCRVIQRVLERCTDEQKNLGIMDEILQSACNLAQDQYGNYVAQHVLEHGKPHERSEIISKLAGQIVQMSQHKFASNVVEKCLEYGDPMERQMLIDEMLGQTEENENLQAMMKDQFANYVVQKVLETCNDQQREKLLARIRVHLHALKKYTYGKHIVARVEKLLTVGEKRSSQI
eukprot:Gb_23280 [translate_table: standard]